MFEPLKSLHMLIMLKLSIIPRLTRDTVLHYWIRGGVVTSRVDGSTLTS